MAHANTFNRATAHLLTPEATTPKTQQPTLWDSLKIALDFVTRPAPASAKADAYAYSFGAKRIPVR